MYYNIPTEAHINKISKSKDLAFESKHLSWVTVDFDDYKDKIITSSYTVDTTDITIPAPAPAVWKQYKINEYYKSFYLPVDTGNIYLYDHESEGGSNHYRYIGKLDVLNMYIVENDNAYGRYRFYNAATGAVSYLGEGIPYISPNVKSLVFCSSYQDTEGLVDYTVSLIGLYNIDDDKKITHLYGVEIPMWIPISDPMWLSDDEFIVKVVAVEDYDKNNYKSFYYIKLTIKK